METKEEVGDEKLWEDSDSNAGKCEAMRQLGVRLEKCLNIGREDRVKDQPAISTLNTWAWLYYWRNMEVSLFQEVRLGLWITMSLAQEFNVPMEHCNGNPLFIQVKHIFSLHSTPVLQSCLMSIHMGLKHHHLYKWHFLWLEWTGWRITSSKNGPLRLLPSIFTNQSM